MSEFAAKCVDLSVGYRRVICSGVSFELPQGQSLLIGGLNGAGKSTLLRTLFALIPKMGGSAEIAGVNLINASPERLMRANCRFLGQGVRSFDHLSMRQNREVLKVLYNFSPGSEVPEALGSLGSSKAVGDLSVGLRRLASILMLASGSPRVYLLDEPIAGIDALHEDYILEWIGIEQQKGASFIIVEQRFRRLLPVCHLALVLRSGKIAFCGNSSELSSDSRIAELLI
jgi:branched-chain amino acid transport system ATP-binding protein